MGEQTKIPTPTTQTHHQHLIFFRPLSHQHAVHYHLRSCHCRSRRHCCSSDQIPNFANASYASSSACSASSSCAACSASSSCAACSSCAASSANPADLACTSRASCAPLSLVEAASAYSWAP